MKPLSTTKWSSRIDAIGPFSFQIAEIYDTLMAIEEDPTFAILARSEAASLAKELNSFTFLCLKVMA